MDGTVYAFHETDISLRGVVGCDVEVEAGVARKLPRLAKLKQG